MPIHPRWLYCQMCHSPHTVGLLISQHSEKISGSFGERAAQLTSVQAAAIHHMGSLRANDSGKVNPDSLRASLLLVFNSGIWMCTSPSTHSFQVLKNYAPPF